MQEKRVKEEERRLEECLDYLAKHISGDQTRAVETYLFAESWWHFGDTAVTAHTTHLAHLCHKFFHILFIKKDQR